MIKYFSDIQCDSKYAYLLYHGVETNKLEYSPTYLLIYDLDSYKNVANIRLDYYFDQLLVNNAGKIILSSPNHEDQIYVFQMNHDNLTL